MTNTQLKALFHAIYYLARAIILAQAKRYAEANDEAHEIRALMHELD